MALELNQTEQDGNCIVAAKGEIDLYSSPQLREAILKACKAKTRKVGIDLPGRRLYGFPGVATLVRDSRRGRRGFLRAGRAVPAGAEGPAAFPARLRVSNRGAVVAADVCPARKYRPFHAERPLRGLHGLRPDGGHPQLGFLAASAGQGPAYPEHGRAFRRVRRAIAPDCGPDLRADRRDRSCRAYTLQKWGATQLIANLVGISALRELAPLMTAILITGRFAAPPSPPKSAP